MSHKRTKIDYPKLSKMTGIHRDVLAEVLKVQTPEQKNHTLNFIFQFINDKGTEALNKQWTTTDIEVMPIEIKQDFIKKEGAKEFTKQFYQNRFKA
jgi:hypothetical protein